MGWSLVVKNGSVVDGSGVPAVRADVALDGDRIAAVAPGLTGEAARVIDAAGLIVAPGFIDMHAHSDFFYLQCPSAESKVRQGVTTEVVGMCSFSPAPVHPERKQLLERLASALGSRLAVEWTSFGEYLQRLATSGPSINVAHFVGHGALRLAAMGADDRPPTAGELKAMEQLLHEALDAGAFGFSTGLVYPPSVYARTDELIALARSLAPRGGLYFSHIRGEAATLEEAILEAIRIGEEGGVPVQIAHIKAAGRENWAKMDRALRLIDEARARGVEVTADVYPYTAGSTVMVNLLPPWVHAGGLPKLLERIVDLPTRKRVLDECTLPGDRWRTASGSAGWEDVRIATCSRRELEGLTIAELAHRRGRPGRETMLDFLHEEKGEVSMILFSQAEENVIKALAHPQVMIGSDSIGLSAGPGPHPGRPHPRMYGTFPRILGVYVREKKVLAWENAVAKMTGMAAMKLGLPGRGLLRPGYFADLALFDPATVRDKATYEDPHRHPTGIPYVIVNGQVVVDQGLMHALPAGRILSPR
ncbi:MAG: D-aminoacylase [Candidatus Rokubacteria bacterium]|nr:D-aminoacylase [Candidatus Rokubacteria bacterium]